MTSRSISRRRQGLKTRQLDSHLQETIWLETEAAATEGRCQALFSPQAYQHLKDQEQADYLTPSERYDYWGKVEADHQNCGAEAFHAKATTESQAESTLFELARQTVEAKQQWQAGETVTLWSGKTHKACVTEGGYDGGGLLYLVFSNRRPGQEVTVTCGFLNPLRGWRFFLDKHDYRKWVSKARRLAGVC